MPQHRIAVDDSFWLYPFGGYPLVGDPAMAVQVGYSDALGVAFDKSVQEAWVLGFARFPPS